MTEWNQFEEAWELLDEESQHELRLMAAKADHWNPSEHLLGALQRANMRGTFHGEGSAARMEASSSQVRSEFLDWVYAHHRS